MAEDIAPVLYDMIKKDFDAAVSKDSQIQLVLARIEAGTATHEDTQKYAIRVGKQAAKAMQNNVTPEVLPDGKMYYNIAERTVAPVLQENHKLVTDVAAQIQVQLNTAEGIGLKAIKPEVSKDRIEGIINRLTAAEQFEDVAWLLDDPVMTFTQSVADDFMRENAMFQAKAGLYSKIIRKPFGRCCDWCADLAGEYEYGDEPHDVYRRHANCRCLVIMAPVGGGRQNVHTKRLFASQEAAERVELAKQVLPKTFYKKIRNSDLPNGLPINARINAVIDKVDDSGKVLQRRQYGPDGKAMVDYDTTDHGMREIHPTGAHKHMFDFSKKNPHGKPLPLTDKELEENADIIKKGVNYHDEK